MKRTEIDETYKWDLSKIIKTDEEYQNYIEKINDLSDNISRDLQKRGMKFVGNTIIYSYLQAIGVIYSHDKECYLYKEKQWWL